MEQTFINQTDELVGVTSVDGRTGTVSTVWTTVGHPFWTTTTGEELVPIADPGSPHATKQLTYATTASGETRHANQGWVFATDLKPGYTLATSAGHDALLLQARHKDVRTTKVYNFRVKGTHTYFVSGAQTVGGQTPGLWVHNQNAGKTPGQFRDRKGNLRDADGRFATDPTRPKSPDFDSARARRAWEKANGRKWPQDPTTGENFDVHHKTKRSAGGALYDPDNILPMHPLMHDRYHASGGPDPN